MAQKPPPTRTRRQEAKKGPSKATCLQHPASATPPQKNTSVENKAIEKDTPVENNGFEKDTPWEENPRHKKPEKAQKETPKAKRTKPHPLFSSLFLLALLPHNWLPRKICQIERNLKEQIDKEIHWEKENAIDTSV